MTGQHVPSDPLAFCSYSGLGYIAGSKVKDVAGDWHWALRVSLVIVWGVSRHLTDLLFDLQTPSFLTLFLNMYGLWLSG